jgi:hypothetical protein
VDLQSYLSYTVKHLGILQISRLSGGRERNLLG